MSSPPCKPGRGSPVVPVSVSSQNILVAGVTDAAAAQPSKSSPCTTPEPAPFLATATSDLSPPKTEESLPTRIEEATGSGQVPPVSVPPVLSVPSTHPIPSSRIPLVRASTTSHADLHNKYPRAATLPHRPNGPSLLTKALATARGIPPSSQVESSSSNGKSSTRPVDVPPQSQSQSQTQPQESHDSVGKAPRSSQDDASEHALGHVLTPRVSSLPNQPSIRATDAVTITPLPNAGDMATTTTYNMLEFQDISSMLRNHVPSLGASKGRGSSLERTDRERRVPERPSRAVTFSHSSREPASLVSHYHPDSSAIVDDSNTEDADAHEHATTRHQPLSIGPSQAWSIGSRESQDGQDGQVEKSITEALTGVEPNVRSRKASHSLRFFREGLPDDKSRRRESRPGPQRGEQLTASSDNLLGAKGDRTIHEQSQAGVDDHRSLPSPGLEKPGRSVPLPSVPSRVSESPEDYFLLNRHGNQNGSAHDTLLDLQLPDPALRVSDVEKASTQLPPPSARPNRHSAGESEDKGECTEDADDSGEEKISSAVFLPHQGLEPSPEGSPVLGKPAPSPPTPRPTTRAEDFHQWLVKADEPEADRDNGIVSDPTVNGREFPGMSPEVKASTDDYATKGNEQESETKLTSSIPLQYEDHVHEHQLAPSKPLDAIELIPYKHQVGGHTTLWRFSKRAVCKQLNNRENEFYEKVEHNHRDLLAFLPRYIGVLNVTFKKQPRRRSTVKRDDAGDHESRPVEEGETDNGAGLQGNSGQDEVAPRPSEPSKATNGTHQRVISQSLQSTQGPVPTVTFVDNQHILPRNLLQPSPGTIHPSDRPRSASTTGSELYHYERSAASPIMRPSLEDRHANSWGATTVNKKLRNEVFNDAFLKRGPIMIERHRKGHQRPLPRWPLPLSIRSASSDPNLLASQARDGFHGGTEPRAKSRLAMLQQSHSDIEALALPSEESDVKDITGTSAPEPDIIGHAVAQQRRKRRHSGSALRRKPADVQEARGDLKLFMEADEAGYKGDSDDVEGITGICDSKRSEGDALDTESELTPKAMLDTANLSAIPSAATSEAPSPTAEFKRIPRPVNPKEAQTQKDSRVEYFLLLEDLTAGMKRPCIMDLKMGTRQYGVDASPKKQKSQQGKCAKTTSRELGVRVCGLQVWDVKTQSYVFRDKYYGRNIKAGDEFQEALTRFLYDGVDYSSVLRHIPTILQKLSQLEVIISRLDGYRFYAASLLMFYDGDKSDSAQDATVEDSTTDFATDTEDAPRRSRKNGYEIDFKMADFANCIAADDQAKEKTCPPAHPDEPDRGFLRGLRSLRKYFLKIQRDIRNERGLVGQLRQGPVNDWELDYTDDEGEVSV